MSTSLIALGVLLGVAFIAFVELLLFGAFRLPTPTLNCLYWLHEKSGRRLFNLYILVTSAVATVAFWEDFPIMSYIAIAMVLIILFVMWDERRTRRALAT